MTVNGDTNTLSTIASPSSYVGTTIKRNYRQMT